METLLILVKLICAHLCSDFIFQTDKINGGKLKPGIKGIAFQLLHSTIHAGVAYLFVAEWTCWIIPAVIFVYPFHDRFRKMQDESELTLHIPCRPVLSYYGNCSAVVSPLWQRE